MMFLSFRRHALCVPVALSLWGASSLGAVAAEPATPMVASDDPASPDAPAGPLPADVLSDFVRPALSVATSDWRMVNASVSGMSGMSGSGHDMPSHSGHAMNPPARTGHEAMGHAMPMTSPPGVSVDPHAGHGGQGGLQ